MISTCPSCQKPVSIPSGVDSAARVHCPLCNCEYVLSEALALVPPELIPVVAEAPVSTSIADVAFEPPVDVDVPTRTDEPNEAAAVAERVPETSAAAVLQRRRSKSALRILTEVVTGGLAGCLFAYYGLALWYGPEFHRVLPELPLPMISQLTAPPEKPPEEKAAHRKPVSTGKSTGADATSN
jgi:hypothetical protein